MGICQKRWEFGGGLSDKTVNEAQTAIKIDELVS